MRCTQIIGLIDEAREFLDNNVARIPDVVCPKCGEVISTKKHIVKQTDVTACGMFDDGPILNTYQLQDGSRIREIVQAIPWSSGPCIFLCLEKTDGTRMFEWPQEEIDEA